MKGDAALDHLGISDSLDRKIRRGHPEHALEPPHKQKAATQPPSSVDILFAPVEATPPVARADQEEAAAPPTAAATPAVVDKSIPIDNQPSYHWTWLLFSRGYAFAEAVKTRGLNAEEIVDHLSIAAENDLEIDPAWFLSSTEITAIEQAIASSADLKIRSVLQELSMDVQYHYVQLYLTWRQRQ